MWLPWTSIRHLIICPVEDTNNFSNMGWDQIKMFAWTGDFFKGRKEFLSLEESLHGDISSGLPQGSMLGPVLFVFFVNEYRMAWKVMARYTMTVPYTGVQTYLLTKLENSRNCPERS